jgi:hypothetical protein
MGEAIVTGGFSKEDTEQTVIPIIGDILVGDDEIVLQDAIAAKELMTLFSTAVAVAFTITETGEVFDKNDKLVPPNIYLAMGEPRHKILLVTPSKQVS